ncbi:MAG: YceI family protein [Flavobacteriales bacterium]|nr:YceI family protein [Flavobacteriales bacterium]
MKNIMTLGTTLVLTLAAFASNDEGTTRYKVDTNASSITWHATKVMGEHMGTVNVTNGVMSITDGTMTSANVIADMSSIACTDLEGEWADKLVGHLNSDDFFNVSEHKTSSFLLRNMEALKDAKGDATHTVTGDFTIRGITQSVTFEATISDENGTLSISGSVVLDQSQFGVKYGSGSFFENLGDNLIHDEFTVGFNLVAQAQ